MTIRSEALQALLSHEPKSQLLSLAGDASTRRYYRWKLPDKTTRVVMDYGAPFTEPSLDQTFLDLYAAAGLPIGAPCFAIPEVGLLVLEDLGEIHLEDIVLNREASLTPVEQLYFQAVDWIVQLVEGGSRLLETWPKVPARALDTERFRFEMDFFLEHYLGSSSDQHTDLRSALHQLAEHAANITPKVCCHRDVHSRNILVRGDGGIAFIDIQDTQWGPEGYDLVSLVYDPYVNLDPTFREQCIERYISARSPKGSPAAPEHHANKDNERFKTVGHSNEALEELSTHAVHPSREALDLLAVERLLKALGTFGFQFRKHKTDRYLSAVPVTMQRLKELQLKMARLENGPFEDSNHPYSTLQKTFHHLSSANFWDFRLEA